MQEVVPGTEEESAASDDDHHKKPDEYDSLYPFLGISFFDKDPEFVHPEPKDSHMHAEPEECDVCADQNAKIAELEYELAWLKAHLYTAPRQTYGGDTSYSSRVPLTPSTVGRYRRLLY